MDALHVSVFVKLRLCLFGEYNGPLTSQDTYGQCLKNDDAKSFEKAIALLPDYFAAIYAEDADERAEMEFLCNEGYMRPREYDLYRFLPDIELRELVDDMRQAGYTQKEIETFATHYMQLMMSYEKVFRSSMTVLLCGKHISGVRVDIPGSNNFADALSLIPDYIRFLSNEPATDYYEDGTVDFDTSLHDLIQQMHEGNYSEEDKVRFASAWFDAIEAQEEMSLNIMWVYLFGRFRYIGSYNKTTELSLPEKKDFAKALASIPKYVDFMSTYNDPCWDDGVRLSPERTLKNHLVPTMQEYGYTDEEIQTFCAKWNDAQQQNKCPIEPFL